MKYLVILLLSINSSFASGLLEQFFDSADADQICKNSLVSRKQTLNFIKGDEKEVYFSYTKKNTSKVVIRNLIAKTTREFQIEGVLQDILIGDTEVFYLTKNTIYIAERFTNKLTKKLRTLPEGMNHRKNATARGIYVNQGLIYIAHGEYGVVVYDREYDKFLPFINPVMPQPAVSHRSLVTDIEGANGKLYMSYDNITMGSQSRAFEGLMIWSLTSNSTQKIIPINQNREAYHLSHLTVDNDELIITNLFLNFRHKLKKLDRDRVMRPMQRIWSYPNGKLIGRSLIHGQRLLGCFNDPNSNIITAGSIKLK